MAPEKVAGSRDGVNGQVAVPAPVPAPEDAALLEQYAARLARLPLTG